MKLRAFAALVLPLAFALTLHASSDERKPAPSPNLVDKTWGKTLEILHLKHGKKPAGNPPAQMHHQLELKLDLSPNPVQLSVDRVVKVTVSLFNRSSKYVHLDFPTTQRIEVLVRDGAGKVVNTWSEDQSFTNDPTAVTLNPGERLEYTASVPTREMAADHPYAIEASFPNYPELKIQQQMTPKK